MDIQVAILDNDKDQLLMMKLALEDSFSVFATSDTNEFISNIKQPAVLIVDWNLDYGIIGNDVVKKVLEKNTLVHPIYVSSHVTIREYEIASEQGWGFFFEPKDDTDFFKKLVEKINRARALLRVKIDAIQAENRKNQLIAEQIDKTMKLFGDG